MKNFKNEFGVKGSISLIKAFKEEVEKLGWKYDDNFKQWSELVYRGNNPLLYFCVDDHSTMKRNHFSLSSSSGSVLQLPNDWNKALKLASEVIEEVPKVKDTIEIAGYKAEFYHGDGDFGPKKLVRFGYKSGITRRDVYAIETIQQLCNHLNLSIQFSRDRLVVNGDSVDPKTISKLIDKLD